MMVGRLELEIESLERALTWVELHLGGELHSPPSLDHLDALTAGINSILSIEERVS